MKLPYGWEFRPMKTSDIPEVLRIIFDHDEDDGAWAEQSYQNSGVLDQFVLTFENQVTGTTGFRYAEGTEDAYWLSWTYIDEEHQGQKMGTRMLAHLFEALKKKNARKIFVSLSDYVDPEDGPIYEKALSLYKSAGFNEEMVHRDYYEPGESEMIYGYSLRLPLPRQHLEEETRGIILTDLFEIDETDDVYAVEWEYSEKGCFKTSDMQAMLREAKYSEARSVFVSFPSNVFSINNPLQECGFTPCGMLENYYSDGVHEVHFRYNF